MISVERLKTRGTMSAVAVGSKSRFLSMALASRNLMNRLDSYSQSGQLGEQVEEALRDLLKVMDTSWQTSNSFAPLPSQSPFGRYAQALMVAEVAEPFRAQDVRGKLERIVNQGVAESERDGVVREVNDFLYDLENRALYKYGEESSEREW